MPTIVWILIWVAIIGTVTVFTVREVRSKRKGPGDIDRLRHSGAAEAEMRSSTQGPNGFGQTWIG